MADARHWVEDLFPPVYSIDGTDATEGEKDEGPGTDVYQMAANRISRFDPETIKNFYERVWLLTTVQEQERQQREQEDLAKKEAELAEQAANKLKLTSGDRTRTLVAGALGYADVQHGGVDTEDASLWSSEELGVLREVFSAARRENVRLKAELQDAEQRAAKLEARQEKKSSALTEKERTLNEAKKANARLQLLIASLKRDVVQLEKENQELRDDLQDMKEEKSETAKELHAFRQELDSERIRRENLEIDLESSRKMAARGIELHEERLVARHSHQVAALEKQIDALQVELAGEKKQHARTRKGLEHLQKHFSSLPFQDSQRNKTMVTQNELQNWSY